MLQPKWLRWPWLLGAVLAYYLPWIANPAAALTFNAYDLAEWTSLPPAVRGATIPLLVSFFLRAVLGLLALLFGLRAFRELGWRRWLYDVLALWLAITLMPPLDFFRGTFDDVNYRQQFALGTGTLILLAGLAALGGRWFSSLAQRRIEAIVAVLAMVSALAGQIMAQGIVRSFYIPAPLGIGIVLIVASLGMVSVAAVGSRHELDS